MKSITNTTISSLLKYFKWAKVFDLQNIDIRHNCSDGDDDPDERWTEVRIPLKANKGKEEPLITPRAIDKVVNVLHEAWHVYDSGLEVGDKGRTVLLLVM